MTASHCEHRRPARALLALFVVLHAVCALRDVAAAEENVAARIPGQPAEASPEWALRPRAGGAGGGATLTAKPPSVTITSIEIATQRRRTIVTLTVTGGGELPAFSFLPNPNRAIVDMADTRFDISRDSAQKSGRTGIAISGFRFGQLEAGRARIVFDLAYPVSVAATKTENAAGGAKFIYELEKVSQQKFISGIKKPAAPAAAAAARPAQASGANDKRPLIVLDPGHGGIDSGARGRNVLPEKDVVLAFATVLAEHLRKSGQYQVLLTRSDDTFVPLPERVRIARDAGAKLFISIHADTLNAASVSGATVYTVSDRASDVHAAKLAEKENQADKQAGFEASEDKSEVSDILFDLTRKETRALSHFYARSLVAYWKGAGSLNKNPVRSAGFRVLMAPDVPSVLLELGYLSSRTEAALLSSPEWRAKAALAVADSVGNFFAPNRRRQETAGGGQKAEITRVSVPDTGENPHSAAVAPATR